MTQVDSLIPARQQTITTLIAVLGLVLAAPVAGAAAAARARGDALHALATRDAALYPSVDLEPIAAAPPRMPAASRSAWERLDGRHPGWSAIVDRRSGLVEIAEGAVPWLPGDGNSLVLGDLAAHLRGRSVVDLHTLESISRAFLTEVAPLLGAEGFTLRLDREASGSYGGYLWQVELDAYPHGEDLPIEGARVFFRVNNGNLVQFGAERLPAPGTPVPAARLDRAAAMGVLEAYLGGIDGPRVATDWFYDRGSQHLLPVASRQGDYAFGEGYRIARVWQFVFARDGVTGSWRARVDAASGELLELKDVNSYSQVTGGIWPVSWRVGGVDQAQTVAGLPFVDLSPLAETSNSSGVYYWDGNPQTASHSGPFVVVNDTCGASSMGSGAGGDVAWGSLAGFGPGDCSTPGGGAGNTASARMQFYHLNKIKEKARGYLPANIFAASQFTTNVNVNDSCNAFWNPIAGETSFFTSGSIGPVSGCPPDNNLYCGNTGEGAAISLHEFGHGLDTNDGNDSSIDNGTGETYGDVTAVLQTHNSCIGNGFITGCGGIGLNTDCDGNGNACSNCDGVRDIDWEQHADNAPMTVASFTQPNCPSDAGGGYVGPCGFGQSPPNDKEGHCESYVSSSAIYDFAAKDLRSGTQVGGAACPPFCDDNGPYNEAGAWQVADRLWYLSRPSADMAFTCNTAPATWTSNGCNAGSNWKVMRFVDDDNGNLNDGTPHSCHLASAFDRHGIACTSDLGWNTCFRGCTPPAAPNLAVPVAGNNRLSLSWTGAGGVVDIFRNEVGCNSGFTRIADDVAGTAFEDPDVANGTTYYYQIVEHPAGNESCGSVPSTCRSATPAASASAVYVQDSAQITAVPADNDLDGNVDNCETGRIGFDVYNDGNVALTGVEVTITSPEASVSVTTTMPVNLGALAVDGRVTGSLDFDLDGAVDLEDLDFQVSVTADQMGAGSSEDTFSVGPVELDFLARTDSFETGNDGWSLSGFARDASQSTDGSWSVSSIGGAGTCDDAASPAFIPTASTSVTLAVRYDIQPPVFACSPCNNYVADKANVHLVELDSGEHLVLEPTGEVYNQGANPQGWLLCHATFDDGWIDQGSSWPGWQGDAVFDLSAYAGRNLQLEVNYNTDSGGVGGEGAGFWFDHARWTDLATGDAQSDSCTPCTPPAAPTGVTATADAPNQIRLDWNGVAPAPTDYRIYRSTSMGGPYVLAGTVGGGTLTFDDTGLTPLVTYYYAVRAFDVCESADSNEASAIPFGDCMIPPTFGGLQTVTQVSAGGSCGLRLEWPAGTNNCGSEPVVYNVYRSTTTGFTPADANRIASCVANPFYDDTAVAGGTAYYYVVRAEDDAVGAGGPCRTGNEETNSVEDSGTPPSGAPVLLYDQTANQASGYSSQNFGDFPAFSNERGADFVVPGGGWTIDRVVAVGTYSAPLGGLNPTVDVRFYADDGGGVPLSLPQDPAVCTYPGLVSGVDFTDTAGSFDISLPAPCNLLAGRYWVSVVANRNFNPGGVQWFWTAVTGIGGSEHAWRNPGNGFGSGCVTWSNGMTACGAANPDVAFQVWGPGSACFLAPGAAQFLTATASGTAGSGQNVLEWLNPSAGGYGSTMIRYSTGGYPADPTDGTLLVDQNDGLGSQGTITHGGLANDTTYYYSTFVDNGVGEYSARKTVSARPFDASGPVKWAYSTGASALAPPGIGSVYGVANDRVLHSMTVGSGAGAGTWPSGWTPVVMNGPAQSRPPIVPIVIGGATRVAFLGSQDRHVYAVNAATGQQIWSSPDLGAIVQGSPAGIYTAFGGAYDLILAGTRNSAAAAEFFGLNLADGTIAWTYTNAIAQGGDDLPMGIISSNPVVDWATQRVYFASRARLGGSPDTVWCLNFTDTGVTRQWARAIGDVDGTPILFGGRLYIGTNSGEVHALDPVSGLDLWSQPFSTSDGPIKGYIWPRFGTSELLFSTTHRLWSITDNGGSATLNPNWPETTITNPSIPLPFTLAGTPYLWLGSGDGRLYQLDLSAADPPASKTWVTLGDGSATVGSPALDVAQEIIYAGTEEGRLYAVTLPLP